MPGYDSAVRLVASGSTAQWSQASGVLEVYLNSQWGTVCSEQLVPTVADSACRQLGYTNASSYSSVSAPYVPWLSTATTVVPPLYIQRSAGVAEGSGLRHQWQQALSGQVLQLPLHCCL